jgi:hypothetical protein
LGRRGASVKARLHPVSAAPVRGGRPSYPTGAIRVSGWVRLGPVAWFWPGSSGLGVSVRGYTQAGRARAVMSRRERGACSTSRVRSRPFAPARPRRVQTTVASSPCAWVARSVRRFHSVVVDRVVASAYMYRSLTLTVPTPTCGAGPAARAMAQASDWDSVRRRRRATRPHHMDTATEPAPHTTHPAPHRSPQTAPGPVGSGPVPRSARRLPCSLLRRAPPHETTPDPPRATGSGRGARRRGAAPRAA